MTEAIVSIAVETLSNLLRNEIGFLSGVTDQVQGVSRELTRMQCFLQDADTRDYKDVTVPSYLKEIRSLTYRIEDVVETFAVKVASKRGKGMKEVLVRSACIFCEIRSLHKIGLEITKIETDISNLTTSLERYGIKAKIEQESSGASNKNQWLAKQTHAHEVEECFVGMDEDINKLVPLVVEDQSPQRIISIWGMGGIGKTTIARKIYKHINVQRCFERFAWACITQQGQITSILRDILIQVLPEDKEQVRPMERNELVRELYRVQREKKCLVVIDDIWKKHHWEELSLAFPVAEGGSKILLTTRIEEVAKIGLPYELKCLKQQESWDLLKTIAFSKKNEVPNVDPKLKDVGIEMVRKCGGLPLAIIVLGGMLKDKTTLREWQVVNKNIDSYLSKGESSEEGKDGGKIAGVLSLSYNALPYHLKPCFLYLGIFEEDKEIYPEELYLLWIAEGMILSQHKERGETLREVAERYLNELGQRSMVQLTVNDWSIYRKFRSCRLHDVMRDFCLKKGKEEDFIEVVDLRDVEKPSLDSLSPIARIAYRLVIHTSDEVEDLDNGAPVLNNYKQLRSLLFRNVRCTWYGRKIISWPIRMINYESFESLRVLKFEWLTFEGQKLSRGLGKLIHLRLLSFNGSLFDEGPLSFLSSVFNLPFLQTLDLQTSGKIEIPNDLGQMKRLRHLYFPFFEIEEGKEKLRLHGLSELETLEGFASSKFEIADLNELVNLRILVVIVTDNESLRDIIKYMMSNNGQNLQEMILHIKRGVSFCSEEGSTLLRKVSACGNVHELEIRYVKVSKFPPYEEHFLPSLVILDLCDTEIDEDPMKTLEKLPQLRVLSLGSDSYTGKDLICHEFGFPQLQSLRLLGLPNLCWWRVDKGGMPNLSCLRIVDCRKLEKIPHGLKYVAGLQELRIYIMPPTFTKRIKVVDGREGEDFDIIRHVPSITFTDCFSEIV